VLTLRRWTSRPERRRLPRRAPTPLPDALRARLLAIPATAPAGPIVPRWAGGIVGFTLESLLAAPLLPLAASFVLVAALGLAGNPYRLGAATLARLQHRAAPAGAWVSAEATAVGTGAARLARGALAIVPAASLRAARTLSAGLTGGLFDESRRSTSSRERSRGAQP
jgi:hypothetical protein